MASTTNNSGDPDKGEPFYYKPRIVQLVQKLRSQRYYANDAERQADIAKYNAHVTEMKAQYGAQKFQAQWNAEYRFYCECVKDATVEKFGCPEPPPMTKSQIEGCRRYDEDWLRSRRGPGDNTQPEAKAAEQHASAASSNTNAGAK